MTEEEMVGWPYPSNEYEFEQTPGNSEGQGSLMCFSLWCHKDSDMTQKLNNMPIYTKQSIYGTLKIHICSDLFKKWSLQQKRHRCIEQSFGLCGRGRGWDDLEEWH